MDVTERNIDVTTTSMSVVELNNMISSMRHLVRRSRVQVVRQLTNQIKKYKSKKGSEKQKLANQKKVDRLVVEMKAVKRADIDRVLKFSLSNSQTIQNLNNQDNAALKANVRLSCQKVVQDKVLAWRKEHNDWKSLAAFIQQHTSRRLKPKKERLKETVKPQQSSDSEEETDDEQKQETTDCSGSKLDKNNLDNIKVKQMTKSPVTVTDCNTKDKNSRDKDNIKREVDNKLVIKKITKLSPRECNTNITMGKSESDSELGSDNSDDDSVVGNKSTRDIERDSESSYISKDSTDGITSLPSEENFEGVVNRGEVVVKRLNLDELVEDDVIKIQETDVAFLFKGDHKMKNKLHNVNIERKPDEEPKSRDSFFLTGSDSEEGTSYYDHNHDKSLSNEGESENELSEEEELNDAKLIRARKKMMAESTFIGSLLHTKRVRHRISKDDTKTKPSTSNQRVHTVHTRHQTNSNKYAKPISGWKPKDMKMAVKRNVPKTNPTLQKPLPFRKGSATQGQQKPQNSSIKPKAQVNVQTEKLHPSWEASKKRKLEQTAIKPFQGKRTVFND